MTLPNSRSLRRHFVGDEVAVGEDLEVAVAGAAPRKSSNSGCMNGSPPRMPKNELPIALASVDQAVQVVELDARLLGGHIDPAALAAEVAAVDDRNVEERRKELAAFEPLFKQMTERVPLTPKFHAAFHHVFGSVVERMRAVNARTMSQPEWQTPRRAT